MSEPNGSATGAPGFRTHLLEEILPRWLALAPTESGLFRCDFDRRWRHTGANQGTLVSQSRLLFNFATGHRLTGDPRYREAVARGAAFLMRHFRDTTHGGWYWACDASGTVTDATKDSYGHAFVIFGLAHAGQCLGDSRLHQAAIATWEVMKTRLTDALGGLEPQRSRDFAECLVERRTQNPMMHLVEALLALGDATGCDEFIAEARAVADFVLARRRQAGSQGIPEFYSGDWQALPTAQGGRVDVGHQFEWAFLLSAAAERGIPPHYLGPALDLADYGLRVGYDAVHGGVCAAVAQEDGRVLQPAKGYWQQCEAIRALMHLATRRGRDALWEPCARTLAFCRRELIDPEFGGWYGGTDRHKGQVWKLDYHITGMCAEALRLAAPADDLAALRGTWRNECRPPDAVC